MAMPSSQQVLRRMCAMFISASILLTGCNDTGNTDSAIDKAGAALSSQALITQLTTIEPAPLDLPAGHYTLDRSHASLIFRVNHLGFSMFTARFTHFTAQLEFDPNQPSASQLTVEVKVDSLETDFPTPEELDFNQQLMGADWFAAERFPTITYRSTNIIERSSSNLLVEGELTMRGITKPVSFEMTINGGWAGIPQDPRARVGFSGHGYLHRAEFGMSVGIPAPGTSIGVSDQVEFIIEAEFSGPALADRATSESAEQP